MDQLVQCPVCTLFLHNGMSLESHLDTHPKDQVIKALCSLSKNNYGSRTSTPLHSERSYRSRSRTPATDDSGMRWNSSRNSDHERYWRKTPNKSPKISNPSCDGTPTLEDRRSVGEVNYESNAINNSGQITGLYQHKLKTDLKNQQNYTNIANIPMTNYDQQYCYYPEKQEDREIKYSRSAEYNAIENANVPLHYNTPPIQANLKIQNPMLPATPRKGNELVKILPKPSNVHVKPNMASVQYLPTSVKPVHVMMSPTPTFVQKNVQSNMILTGSLAPSQILDNGTIAPVISGNQFNQISSGTFTPGTTVVTQNSQIIYREMVHNIDGKPFVPSMPAVISGHENVTNVAQASSLYQNVMVMDQFGNASCMYATPQQLIQKHCNAPVYNNVTQPSTSDMANDFNKSLVIEVGPIPQTTTTAPRSPCYVPSSSQNQPTEPRSYYCPSSSRTQSNESRSPYYCASSPPIQSNESRSPYYCPSSPPKQSKEPRSPYYCPSSPQTQLNEPTSPCYVPPRSPCYAPSSSSQTQPIPKMRKQKAVKKEGKAELGSTKGLKILSNIKVEVPVQHSKNMLNTIMDLTGPSDTEYQTRPVSPEKIIPDVDEKNICPPQSADDGGQSSTINSDNVSNTFSVIKNVGNPPSYKDSIKPVDSKIENESSDSCPVPDLICNEKPSISPCSELSEQGDNSTDRTSISPKLEINQNNDNNFEKKTKLPLRVFNNPLRLNNIYVKKNKKVLQIKNAKKPFAPSTSTSSTVVMEPKPSSSNCMPENFSMNKLKQDKEDEKEKSTLTTVSIEKINDTDDHHEFDADTEEQSMDIEPVPPSSTSNSNQFATSVDIVQVKEEINTSNEGAFSNEAGSSDNIAPLEALRPINVITYGNMSAADFDDESNHRELLELEAASKNKQFVNMMNDNYFGDNLYADYFTPDKVESFERGSYSKDVGKEGMSIWGEPPQKESEFVLPNFIHESYKIAESHGMDYPEMGDGDADGYERDSKADLLSESRSDGEPPLNICADERMPPRGELSGQESNGDMESPWSGMYTEVTPAEPYDLIARESWVSDDEVESSEKMENLTMEKNIRFPQPKPPRVYTCTLCAETLPSLKELRTHKAIVHGVHPPTYSQLMAERAIKKEEKPDEMPMPVQVSGNLLKLESKEAITAKMMQVYSDVMADAKPKIEGLIKQEAKRRKKDFVCPTCKIDQVTDTAFNEHLKIHPLECLTCGKCFFRRANLALHIKTHLGIKNYKCEVCEKRFMTRQKLAEHHNVHTGRAPIKCTLCDDTFRRYSNMVQHRDRHHFKKKTKVRDYVCQCGSVFHSRAKLLWHKETHDEKPKACLYCSDKFVHSSSLTRHVRRTHNEYYLSDKNKGKAENVTCPVCKQVYLRSNLRAHLLTHSGKRPYLCIVCNKAFTTKWNLKLHRWTHMSRSAKPYKCSLCKGAFIRQTEYIAHMNAHKSVRPYTCNYCGCQFIRKYNCQRHVREHEMAKKYVCKVPECGKSFHRSYYLSEHMKVHSGARPFSCSICGKTSSNKSNHNKHVKIHHAREPIATEA